MITLHLGVLDGVLRARESPGLFRLVLKIIPDMIRLSTFCKSDYYNFEDFMLLICRFLFTLKLLFYSYKFHLYIILLLGFLTFIIPNGEDKLGRYYLYIINDKKVKMDRSIVRFLFHFIFYFCLFFQIRDLEFWGL